MQNVPLNLPLFMESRYPGNCVLSIDSILHALFVDVTKWWSRLYSVCGLTTQSTARRPGDSFTHRQWLHAQTRE